jgi:hypothetical protein
MTRSARSDLHHRPEPLVEPLEGIDPRRIVKEFAGRTPGADAAITDGRNPGNPGQTSINYLSNRGLSGVSRFGEAELSGVFTIGKGVDFAPKGPIRQPCLDIAPEEIGHNKATEVALVGPQVGPRARPRTAPAKRSWHR